MYDSHGGKFHYPIKILVYTINLNKKDLSLQIPSLVCFHISRLFLSFTECFLEGNKGTKYTLNEGGREGGREGEGGRERENQKLCIFATFFHPSNPCCGGEIYTKHDSQ
jgi:hypothetical protein